LAVLTSLLELLFDPLVILEDLLCKLFDLGMLRLLVAEPAQL
jgi:hypothetical protein